MPPRMLALLVLVQFSSKRQKMARQLLWHLPVDLPCQQKFTATELEVAGLVFALEHFEVYVLGNQVIN